LKAQKLKQHSGNNNITIKVKTTQQHNSYMSGRGQNEQITNCSFKVVAVKTKSDHIGKREKRAQK
jgi:hypothetical protein